MSTSPSVKGFPNGIYDHGVADLQRTHEERRKREERQARCEKWLASKLTGHTFHSYEALRYAAVVVTETMYGPLDEDRSELIAAATRALFAGLSETGRTSVKIGETGRVEYVIFKAA
jgi:hypothetical protein